MNYLCADMVGKSHVMLKDMQYYGFIVNTYTSANFAKVPAYSDNDIA